MNEMANRSTFFRIEQSSGTDPVTRALEAKKQQEQAQQQPAPQQPGAVEQNQTGSNSSGQQTPRLPEQTTPAPN